MKKLFLATAAVAALIAAPAAAQNVGSVGLTYGNSQAEFAGFEADADAWNLDGVVAMPAFGDWTVTLNGDVTYVDEDNSDTSVAGAAHLTKMFGSDLRAGGFVAAADAEDDTAWTVGGEVQKYLAKATLTGVVAYSTSDESDADIWTVGGDAAFYVRENLRLNVGASYNDIDGDIDAWTYGVGAEYEFTGTPFAVNAGYVRTDIESLDVDTWTIGLRYSFGGGLQARDRAGAGLGLNSVADLLGGTL